MRGSSFDDGIGWRMEDLVGFLGAEDYHGG
jgi:hypothetical protein